MQNHKQNLCRFRAAAALLALTLSLGGTLPVQASATPNTSQTGELSDQLAAQIRKNVRRYEKSGNPEDLQDDSIYTGPTELVLGTKALPSSYDLRSTGTLHGVENQMDWNTCWSFSLLAASETSILADLGLTQAQKPLDFSERQLAWMAMASLSSAAEANAATQLGEGYQTSSDEVLNSPSNSSASVRALESGSGPVSEESWPYQSKEGLTVQTGSGNWYYSASGDWSVPESARFSSDYALTETRILPYETQADRDAIKQEILNGHGVDIGCYLNTDDTGFYNPQTGASNSMITDANHEVCIIGWDDSYDRTNFSVGSRPAGNGAWLVRNSWGSDKSSAPDANSWGIPDEQGRRSGYCWISYEDRSLTSAVSLYYNTKNTAQQTTLQYSFMNAPMTLSLGSTSSSSIANIFRITDDSRVTSVSCETVAPDTTVTYRVYRLRSGYTSPTDGTLAASLQRTYAFAGFHKENLDVSLKAYCKAGDSVSIVAELSGTSDSGLAALPCGWNETFADQHNRSGAEPYLTGYYKGVVNSGESFYADGTGDDGWTDLTAILSDTEKTRGTDYYVYDNFPLRLYTEDAALTVVAPPVVPSVSCNGTLQRAALTDTELYTVTENNGGTEAGTYPVVLTLRNPDQTVWAGSGDASLTLEFRITEAISGSDDADNGSGASTGGTNPGNAADASSADGTSRANGSAQAAGCKNGTADRAGGSGTATTLRASRVPTGDTSNAAGFVLLLTASLLLAFLFLRGKNKQSP